jgi:hypothetical protein
MRISRVLVSLLAVPIRGLGVLPGRFMLAHLVMVGRLEVVMSSGRVVGGGPVVVLGWGALPGRRRWGVLGGRGHGSILLCKKKKPAWWNTPRYSSTPAYSSTSPPVGPGCPSSK